MNVRYRTRALEDIRAIYMWRARQSLELADSVETAIFATGDWLGGHHKLGAKTDEMNVRRWPMTDFRYTIFYRVNWSNAEIDVLRIRDARQVRNLKRVPR